MNLKEHHSNAIKSRDNCFLSGNSTENYRIKVEGSYNNFINCDNRSVLERIIDFIISIPIKLLTLFGFNSNKGK